MEEVLSFKLRGFLKGNTTHLEVTFPNGVPSIAIILQSIITLFLIGLLLFVGIWVRKYFRQNRQQPQYTNRRGSFTPSIHHSTPFASFDPPPPEEIERDYDDVPGEA